MCFFPRDYFKGVHAICYLFKKLQTLFSHQLNSINNGTFCYSRLYLGIKTASLEKKFDGTYTRMLRKIQNIYWKDKVTNNFLYGSNPWLTEIIRGKRLSFIGWPRVKTQWASWQSSVMGTWWAEKSEPPQNYPKTSLGRWYWFEGSWTPDCYVEQRELEEEFRHANFYDAAK